MLEPFCERLNKINFSEEDIEYKWKTTFQYKDLTSSSVIYFQSGKWIRKNYKKNTCGIEISFKDVPLEIIDSVRKEKSDKTLKQLAYDASNRFEEEIGKKVAFVYIAFKSKDKRKDMYKRLRQDETFVRIDINRKDEINSIEHFLL